MNKINFQGALPPVPPLLQRAMYRFAPLGHLKKLIMSLPVSLDFTCSKCIHLQKSLDKYENIVRPCEGRIFLGANFPWANFPRANFPEANFPRANFPVSCGKKSGKE